MDRIRLQRIYKKLYCSFGKQNWWPAKSRLEVIIGTVLTQNTAWANVEKAIDNLRRHRALSLVRLSKLTTRKLASLIRPAGYFNIKSRRLKNVLDFIQSEYNGSLKMMRASSASRMRIRLLGINGVGPETADSILLYALDKPIFVVDAYTRRVFSRLGLVSADSTYEEIQALFMDNLATDTRLFNEYHALIVKLGKDYCKKNKPNCRECPIRDEH